MLRSSVSSAATPKIKDNRRRERIPAQDLPKDEPEVDRNRSSEGETEFARVIANDPKPREAEHDPRAARVGKPERNECNARNRSDRGWKAVIEISCDGDFRSRNADRDCERSSNPDPRVRPPVRHLSSGFKQINSA